MLLNFPASVRERAERHDCWCDALHALPTGIMAPMEFVQCTVAWMDFPVRSVGTRKGSMGCSTGQRTGSAKCVDVVPVAFNNESKRGELARPVTQHGTFILLAIELDHVKDVLRPRICKLSHPRPHAQQRT